MYFFNKSYNFTKNVNELLYIEDIWYQLNVFLDYYFNGIHKTVLLYSIYSKSFTNNIFNFNFENTFVEIHSIFFNYVNFVFYISYEIRLNFVFNNLV